MPLWLVLIAAVAAAPPSEATLTTLDGQTVDGVVVGWDGKQIELQTSGETKAFPTEQLLDLSWSHESMASSTPVIELIDGSRLIASDVTIAKRVAAIAFKNERKLLRVPTDKIRRIEFLPTSPPLEAALAEVENKQPAGDSLVIVKRDGEAMDYITGVVGDLAAEQVDFKWDGEQVPVKRSKIAAIVFYHAKRAKLPETICELTLADGSILASRRAQLAGANVTAILASGPTVTIPLSQITRIDFSSGKIAYLGDLKPTAVRWTPRIALPEGATTIAAHGLPRNNLSYSGSPLSLQWRDDPIPSRRDVRTYSRGLAIRSRTDLAYRIPDGMARFVAIAGIDPASASQGHIQLTVRGDDRVLWEGVVDGRQPPAEIDVQLGAARRLQLVVDYGENLDYGDRLHLIEARFTK